MSGILLPDQNPVGRHEIRALTERFEDLQSLAGGLAERVAALEAIPTDDPLMEMINGLAARVEKQESDTATALQQIVGRMTELVKVVGDVDTRVHAIEMDGMEKGCAALSGALGAMKSFEDAILAAAAKPPVDQPMSAEEMIATIKQDSRPAWQRAEVGDRVEHPLYGIVKVGEIDDQPGAFQRLRATNGVWMHNDRILSILHPEPERPKDEMAADGHASDCATHNEPAYPNAPCDCGVAPSPASLDALKVEATGSTVNQAIDCVNCGPVMSRCLAVNCPVLAAEDHSETVVATGSATLVQSLLGFAAYMRSGFDPSAIEIEMVAKKFEAAAHALGLSERVQAEGAEDDIQARKECFGGRLAAALDFMRPEGSEFNVSYPVTARAVVHDGVAAQIFDAAGEPCLPGVIHDEEVAATVVHWVNALASAQQPQRVTVTRDQIHEISVKHWYGLSPNDIADGLRVIPGIVIEGE